jgi:hypothetical protein
LRLITSSFLEQLVLADIGADHLGDLAAFEQNPKAEAFAPQLFEMTVSLFTPASRIAAIRLSGLPERPNPPDVIVIASNSTLLNAAPEFSKTLFGMPPPEALERLIRDRVLGCTPIDCWKAKVKQYKNEQCSYWVTYGEREELRSESDPHL